MPEHESDPHYWLGYLSSTLSQLIGDPDVPEPRRKQAAHDLERFLESPASCDELVHMLKEGTP